MQSLDGVTRAMRAAISALKKSRDLEASCDEATVAELGLIRKVIISAESNQPSVRKPIISPAVRSRVRLMIMSSCLKQLEVHLCMLAAHTNGIPFNEEGDSIFLK
ncbi:MAG: hypothetical protein GY820_18300 [Gammaproteobacteria bacterium]|nr:hypothetical protein [Gammaproteobacteria bacterium]